MYDFFSGQNVIGSFFQYISFEAQNFCCCLMPNENSDIKWNLGILTTLYLSHVKV